MHEFYGKHMLAEFVLISTTLINDKETLINTTKKLIKQSGANLIETRIYEFKPHGYTIFWVLKESHVSIHAYPEFGAMFLDIFTCGHNINPKIIADGLCNYLQPQRKKMQMIERLSP